MMTRSASRPRSLARRRKWMAKKAPAGPPPTITTVAAGCGAEVVFVLWGGKGGGGGGGWALWVGGRSPRRGGRERSDRWKGESVACSLQRDDVGKFAGPRAHTPRLLA